MARETIFTLEATPIKFGTGAVDDAGWELSRLGVTRALLVSDPGIPHVERVRDSVAAAGIEVVVFDGSRVEPTLESLASAASFALDAEADGFVSVGGGSSIDTAKVADLVVSHPADVMDYVNAPVGGGTAVPGPLRPHLAIPTTWGTGSEATTSGGVVAARSGSTIACDGRSERWEMPVLTARSGTSRTATVVASEPLPVVVGIARCGRSGPGGRRASPTGALT